MTWLRENVAVIGAIAGVLVALVTVLQLVVVGPMNGRFDDLRSEINQRFDQQGKYMNARFDAVDQRFEEQNKYMNARFDAVDQRFDAVEQRLDRLETEVSELRSLGERISRSEGRIDLLTEQLQVIPTPGR